MRAASEAGVQATREPETYTLLHEAFSREDCRRVFPKRPSDAYRTAFKKLQDFEFTCRQNDCKIPPEQQAIMKRQLLDALPLIDKADSKGLRVDIALVDDATGEERWVDVTSVNTAAHACVDTEMHHTADKMHSQQIAHDAKVPHIPQRTSPALTNREKFKKSKYARLITVADKQFYDRQRTSKPGFIPFAMSTAGELGPDAHSLIAWLIDKFRLKCKAQGRRADGMTVRELVADFHRRLRVTLQFAMAAGMGQLIAEAGTATGGN